MSNSETRIAIRDSATGIAGVTVHPTRPATPQPLDGWVRWRGAERADGFTFMNSWALLVVVAADEEKADDLADTIGYALAAALQDDDVLFVDSITAVGIPTSAGELKGVQIIGRSE